MAKKHTIRLIAGKCYSNVDVKLAGWTGGDGCYDGYDPIYYFDAAGRYLGPDSEGVEPLFRLRVA